MGKDKKIGVDEWRKLLSDIKTTCPENPIGFTTREASELWGCSHNTANKRIREASNIEHVGFRVGKTIVGDKRKYPVYNFIKE